MTWKARLLAAIAGQPIDRMPWVPRLDLWFRANKLAGTLPTGYPDDSLLAFVDAMGVGMHAVIPDFRDLRTPDDDVDRALGIYNLHTMPYRTELDGVQREVRRDGDITHVAYHTPAGTLRTAVLYDEAMRQAGISISHVLEPAIKGAADCRAAGYLFSHANVLPNYAGYSTFANTIGDRGLAVGFVSLAASPMHLIQRELMGLEDFFFLQHDDPDALNGLAEAIGAYWQRVLEVVVDCPAEVLLVGANYDAAVTYPPFFAAHILPWLRRYANALHTRGKYLLTHTDGENTGLLDHYLDAGIDIADSICPAPMTRQSMAAVRQTFADRITIMGGVPSVALLPFSMTDDEFTYFLDDFFRQLGDGRRIILGISDTTPPAADFHRLLQLGKRAQTFGPIPGN